MTNEPEIVKELRNMERNGTFINEILNHNDNSKTSNLVVQKNYEKDLYLSSILLKSLLKNIPDSIYFKDKNGRFVEVSDSKIKHLGMEKEDILGKTDFDFYSKKAAQKMREDELYVMEHNNILTKEEEVIRPNGESTWVSVVKAPWCDGDGNVIGVIGISRDITEQKQAKETLKESEKRYKAIFENSAVAITLTDEKERIVSWNKYAEFLLKMNEDDLYLKPVKSLYPSEEWQKIRSENVRQKGMQHHLETKVIRKNNEPLDVDISISVLRDHNDDIMGSIGVIKDISEQKETERRFNSILEYAEDSIYLIDKNRRYLLVNNELLSRLQLKKEEVIGKTFDDVHSSEETKTFTEKLKLVFEYGKSIRGEHKKDNKWYFRMLTPVKDQVTNKIIAVAVISRDITYRKKAEEKIKILEERYRTIFESSAVAITLTDKNEKIVSWNNYTEKLLNMDKEDLLDKPVSSLYPHEEWEKIRSENVRQKGMQHHLETKILRKNKRPLDVDISISVLRDHNNNIMGSIGVIKDISEQKRGERKLKEAHMILRDINHKLEQKVRDRTFEIEKLLKQKDEFISQLGHDLKTPLTPLINLLPLVYKNEKNEKSKELLDLSIRNVQYMKNLVIKTLKLALLNSSSYVLEIEEINAFETIQSVIKNMDKNLDLKNIKIENLIKENVNIKADRLRFEELMNNLISNAIKYSPDGGKITLKTKVEKNKITFSIKDDGVGMTKEQVEKIFDEFYKTDKSRHDFNSTGLGLSICKRIVEKHKGKMWVESSGPGKGSTFYFTLENN